MFGYWRSRPATLSLDLADKGLLVARGVVLRDILRVEADDFVDVLLEFRAGFALELLNLAKAIVHHEGSKLIAGGTSSPPCPWAEYSQTAVGCT